VREASDANPPEKYDAHHSDRRQCGRFQTQTRPKNTTRTTATDAMAHAQATRPPSPDAEPVVHDLYVFVVGKTARGPSDEKSRELTLAILKYIHERLPLFAEMGVQIRVHKVKQPDLDNPRVVQALEARKISSLPALVTPSNTYVGTRLIKSVYERNALEYDAWRRREVESPTGMTPEDDLAKFYRDEMSFEKAAENDDDSDGIGENGDMMDAYRTVLQSRNGQQPAAAQGRTARSRPPPARGAPPPRRSDNVSANDPSDSLVNRMASDIDSQTLSGSDDLDGEGLDAGGSTQDDLMERAYWANQESST